MFLSPVKVHYVQGTNISKSTVVQYLRELYLLRSNVEKKEMNSLIILLALSDPLMGEGETPFAFAYVRPFVPLSFSSAIKESQLVR